MTQQSLITRLKAVEEALDDSIQRMTRARLMLKKDENSNWGMLEASDLQPALSDLRELIKEAEGQKAISVRVVGGPDNSKYVPHYTALGEKP